MNVPVTSNLWSATVQLASGINHIEVRAIPLDSLCPVVYAGVKVYYHPVTPPMCTKPITNLTVNSHAQGQIVNSGSIVVTWFVDPYQYVQSLQIRVNGGVWMNVPVTSNLWSATVQLASGINHIEVRAIPLDSLCPVVYAGVKVYYHPVTPPMCTKPITNLTVNSHAQGQIVNSGSIVVTWIVDPYQYVQSLQIRVNGGVWMNVPVTSNVWSATVQLASGINHIEVRAIPLDSLCPVVYAGVKVIYDLVVPPVCTQPLGGIVFGSHTNNQLLSHVTQTITLTGTVLQNTWSIKTVRVNWIPANVQSGVWSIVVPLAVGTNQFIVAAESSDSICPNVVSSLTLIRSSWWWWTTCETLVNLQLWHALSNSVSSSVSTFSVFGTVAPWTTLTINWSWVTVTSSWYFSYDVSLAVGTNSYLVKASLQWCDLERVVTIQRATFYYGWWGNYCGDGVVRSGEECDLWANNGKWLWCTTSCRLETPVVTPPVVTPPTKPEPPIRPTFTPLPPFVLPQRLPDTWADMRLLQTPDRVVQTS